MIESGVSGYITGSTTIEVHFPIDLNGKVDICCRQCWYFRHNYSTCGLNGCVCEYPNKYVGSQCPLDFDAGGEADE